MNRNSIAKAIAEDFTILEYVQNIILEHLKDYSLLSGTIL